MSLHDFLRDGTFLLDIKSAPKITVNHIKVHDDSHKTECHGNKEIAILNSSEHKVGLAEVIHLVYRDSFGMQQVDV